MSYDRTGPNNSNWKGGISKNHYHYKKIAKLRHPAMIRAHKRVAYAVKKGNLVRQPCEVCGETKVQAHHDDYSKPLEVRWFCDVHHRQHHHAKRNSKPSDD
jgi:ribosomal protein S27AE